MSPKKSRWSWEKLENAPTVNFTPASRCRAVAWAETSITTHCTPASAMRRRSCWVSTGSGVVRRLGMVSSPIIEHTVPISPVL